MWDMASSHVRVRVPSSRKVQGSEQRGLHSYHRMSMTIHLRARPRVNIPLPLRVTHEPPRVLIRLVFEPGCGRKAKEPTHTLTKCPALVGGVALLVTSSVRNLCGLLRKRTTSGEPGPMGALYLPRRPGRYLEEQTYHHNRGL